MNETPEKPWKNLILLKVPHENDGDKYSLLAHSGKNTYWANRSLKALQHSDEPEIWYVLQHFADENTIFVDGGANIGLWSSAAASVINNPAQVIAIDPSSQTAEQLEQNAALNSQRFTIINKALSDTSGLKLPFNEYGEQNAPLNSLHQMSKSKTPEVREVTTITVDDILESVAQKTTKPASKIIIKLDVEKSEFEALQGAAHTLQTQNALVIYEDHRTEDPNSELTRKILAQGMHVYYVDPQHNVPKIQDSEELRAIKVPPRRGYNFLACMPGSQFDQELGKLSQLPVKPPGAPVSI